MTLYPDVQRKAQAEIDAVVGHDRLPDFQDRERLPYVTALYSEVLRWLPSVPQGQLYSPYRTSVLLTVERRQPAFTYTG